MKPTVLLCGKLPAPDILRACLTPWLLLRKEGRVAEVVLSTWVGETIPEDVASLVRIVASNQPKGFDAPGWRIQQSVTLLAGLRTISPTAFVVKGRPDLALLDGTEAAAILDMDLSRPPSPLPPVFTHRVWVPYFELTTPFFIADQIFYGHHGDLMKLADFSMYREAAGIVTPPPNLGKTHNATDAAPEILRWIGPFLPHFPILRHYLDVFHHIGYWTDRRERVLRWNLTQPMWWRWLALYYLILHTYFRVGGIPGRMTLAREWRETEVYGITVYPKGEVQLDKFLANLMDGLERDWGHLHCDDSLWLRCVFEGSAGWDKCYPGPFFQWLAEGLWGSENPPYLPPPSSGA